MTNKNCLSLANLPIDAFEIKFIDFGLSKTLVADQVTATPVGVEEIVPPEISSGRGKIKFDRRVDVWNTGVFFYQILTGRQMFQKGNKKTWNIDISSKGCNVTLESLKFINDLVIADFRKRPWPENIIEHPYLQLDTVNTPTI